MARLHQQLSEKLQKLGWITKCLNPGKNPPLHQAKDITSHDHIKHACLISYGPMYWTVALHDSPVYNTVVTENTTTTNWHVRAGVNLPRTATSDRITDAKIHTRRRTETLASRSPWTSSPPAGWRHTCRAAAPDCTGRRRSPGWRAARAARCSGSGRFRSPPPDGRPAGGATCRRGAGRPRRPQTTRTAQRHCLNCRETQARQSLPLDGDCNAIQNKIHRII